MSLQTNVGSYTSKFTVISRDINQYYPFNSKVIFYHLIKVIVLTHSTQGIFWIFQFRVGWISVITCSASPQNTLIFGQMLKTYWFGTSNLYILYGHTDSEFGMSYI